MAYHEMSMQQQGMIAALLEILKLNPVASDIARHALN